MKSTIPFLLFLFTTVLCYAQAPAGFSYQAVIRDDGGELIRNSSISLRFFIVRNSLSNVYGEEHTVTTNDDGLVALQIGTGSNITGDLSTIDWSDGTYSLWTYIDFDGGTNFTTFNESQLLSVPFAMYSNRAGEAPTEAELSFSASPNTNWTSVSGQVITFTTEQWDTADLWNVDTFTAPEAGRYQFNVYLASGGAAAQLGLRVRTGPSLAIDRTIADYGISGFNYSFILDLSEDDPVQVSVVTSGRTLTTNSRITAHKLK